MLIAIPQTKCIVLSIRPGTIPLGNSERNKFVCKNKSTSYKQYTSMNFTTAIEKTSE